MIVLDTPFSPPGPATLAGPPSESQSATAVLYSISTDVRCIRLLLLLPNSLTVPPPELSKSNQLQAVMTMMIMVAILFRPAVPNYFAVPKLNSNTAVSKFTAVPKRYYLPQSRD